MKILVVDDEEMILSLTRKILERVGHEVLTAESGQAALDICRDSDPPPGMAIVDLTMAGMTGIETLRRLRALYADIPVIISSGHLSESVEVPEALQAHTATLQKPFQASDILDKIRILTGD